MPKLLTIVAHPDDESSSFGGTLALYAQRGVAVDVVCATRGEAARNRGGAESAEHLKQLRSDEFRVACRLLDVGWCDILDYPDRGLNRESFPDIGARLCRVIRERKPDVVLTLGPEGGFTGHPDHAAISHFTTFAFHAAGRKDLFAECGPPHQPARLYYATGPAPLPAFPKVVFSPITAEIDISDTFARKLEAFECHRTQAPLFKPFREAVSRLPRMEYFHLAAGAPRRAGEMERDLF